MLDEDETRHLARVLRLAEGDHAFVFDGEGREWECEIARAGKREAELNLLRQLDDCVESPLRLTLAQALVKGDKFDWIVRKTTELGVTRIVPILSDHSDVKFGKGRTEEHAENKLQRWRRISLEALKQCGRRRLVEIAAPLKFEEFIEAEATGLFFSERGGRSLRELSIAPDRINLCVAPEGGWSDAEIKKAEGHGMIPVTLGSRVLRTETAAIVAVSLAQHLFGDLR